jgi:HNH endonuclease
LVRDGYKCKVTNVYECQVEELDPDLYEKLSEEDVDFRRTEAAHIIPLCFNNLSSETMVGRSRAWAILDNFAGGPRMVEFLRGQNINNLDNILTLNREIHSEFDDLKVWLEPYGVHNFFNF